MLFGTLHTLFEYAITSCQHMTAKRWHPVPATCYLRASVCDAGTSCVSRGMALIGVVETNFEAYNPCFVNPYPDRVRQLIVGGTSKHSFVKADCSQLKRRLCFTRTVTGKRHAACSA
jgi:hypothetical protein